MKISVAAFALACLLGVALTATAQQQTQDAAPREHSMTGCLQKGAEPGTFKLTNVERVDTVEIAESTANLEPHVTHKIEVTGTAVPNKQPHTMKVTAMKMVDRNCP